MEQEQAEELGQEGLSRRRDGLSPSRATRALERPFAGISFLFVGGVLGWAVLGWVGEARTREAVERRGRELAVRIAKLEEARSALADEKARLERELLTTTLERQRGMESIAELSGRLVAKNASDAAARKEAAPREEPADLRARREFTRMLNRLMRRFGADWLRFYEIAAHEGKELRDVRLLELGSEGVPVGIFLAKTCTITLDRASGRATLLLKKVTRVVDRKRHPEVAEHRVEFEPPDVRAFEAELRDYIEAKGAYPGARPAAVPTSAALAETVLWRDRFSGFLEYAAGEARLDLHRLGGVSDGAFVDVEVLGYSKKGLWERRIKAQRLEVWVDESTGGVELRLRDGFVENSLGRTTFPKERVYRYPLPGVDGGEAQRLLTGFVRKFRSLAK